MRMNDHFSDRDTAAALKLQSALRGCAVRLVFRRAREDFEAASRAINVRLQRELELSPEDDIDPATLAAVTQMPSWKHGSGILCMPSFEPLFSETAEVKEYVEDSESRGKVSRPASIPEDKRVAEHAPSTIPDESAVSDETEQDDAPFDTTSLDFDYASNAWRSNKIPVGEGMFRYMPHAHSDNDDEGEESLEPLPPLPGANDDELSSIEDDSEDVAAQREALREFFELMKASESDPPQVPENDKKVDISVDLLHMTPENQRLELAEALRLAESALRQRERYLDLRI